ncbi:MFS transporter [Streptomyces sp. WAC05458]|uniref:MFS transporter n=1 Tax=Streptomyces rochei TaxID=1928 RepID=A0ABW7E8I7_STRRO|nr:MFS transporter [Streptomyces sp. WAC05458]RSS17524.1 MFS transporter [Streptomyces sp. WAC05458]
MSLLSSRSGPPSPDGAPLPAQPLCVLALAFLVLFIDGYDLFTLGTVGPELLRHGAWGREITAGTLGMLGSATGIGMILGSAAAGRAGDRFGIRLPLVIALSVISVSMLLSALAPGLSVFVVARVLTGLGVGALAPLVGSFVTAHAPRRRRTLYIAVAMAALGLGGAASAYLGRALLPETDFRWLFAPGVLPLLLVPFLLRSLPQRRPSAADAPGDTGPAHRSRALLDQDRRRVTVLLWVASFMSIALIYSTSNWLPSVMLKAGYDLNSALEFSTAFTLGASVGTTALSLLADRGHLRVVTLAGFLLAAGALLALSTPQPRPVLLLLSALAGVGSLGTQSLVVGCMAASYPPQLIGTGMGFGLAVGRFGAIVGPSYLAAVTTWIASPKAGFYAFIMPAVFGAVAIAFLPRARASEQAQTQVPHAAAPAAAPDPH